MDARLVIIKGKASKSHISLKLPTIIGRSRDADLKIAHPMISRQHCQLFEEEGLLKIRDLGSLNGVYVGGQQVNEATLPPEAVFTVGPLTFRAEYEYAGELPETPEVVPAAGGDVPDFQAIAEPADTEEEGAEEAAEVVPADEGPSIAPPDGEMPDFSAWARVDTGEEEEEEEPPPPPPAVEDRTVSFEEEIAEAEEEEPEPTPPPPMPPASVAPEEALTPDPNGVEATVERDVEEVVVEGAEEELPDEVEMVEDTPPPPPPPAAAEQPAAAAPAAEGAGPEIDFGAALGSEGEEAGPTDEEDVEELGEVEEIEAEPGEEPAAAEPAEEEPAAEEPSPKKKKGWWPFGGKKKKGAEEATPAADAPDSETARAEEATEAVEPAAETPPKPPIPQAPAPAPAEKPQEDAPDFLAAMGAEEKKPAAGSDDDLNQFLKGLG